jgi:hypothetical protein
VDDAGGEIRKSLLSLSLSSLVSNKTFSILSTGVVFSARSGPWTQEDVALSSCSLGTEIGLPDKHSRRSKRNNAPQKRPGSKLLQAEREKRRAAINTLVYMCECAYIKALAHSQSHGHFYSQQTCCIVNSVIYGCLFFCRLLSQARGGASE